MKRLLFLGSRVFEAHLWSDDNVRSIGVCGAFTPEEETEETGGMAEEPAVEPVATHFLEIELVDEDGQPVPNERYRVTFANGTVQEGRLNANGLASFPNLQSDGECQVSFPALDQEAWAPV